MQTIFIDQTTDLPQQDCLLVTSPASPVVPRAAPEETPLQLLPLLTCSLSTTGGWPGPPAAAPHESGPVRHKGQKQGPCCVFEGPLSQGSLTCSTIQWPRSHLAVESGQEPLTALLDAGMPDRRGDVTIV